MGLLTEEARRQELIDLWTECTAEVSKEVEEKFKDISEAYDVLSKKEDRQKYDAIRQFGMGGARFAGGSGAGGFDASGFSDIFGSMFGQGAGGNGSRIRLSTSGGGNPNLNDIFSMFGGAAGQGAGGYGQQAYGNAGGEAAIATAQTAAATATPLC